MDQFGKPMTEEELLAMSPQEETGTPPAELQDAMSQMSNEELLSRYQQVMQAPQPDMSALNEAKEERDRLNLIAASQDIAQGLIGSTAGPNFRGAGNAVSKFARQKGQNLVTDAQDAIKQEKSLQQEQKRDIKGLLDMYNSSRKAETQINKSMQDIAKGKLDLSNAETNADPASEPSRVAREIARKLNPQIAETPGFEEMSATQVGEAIPGLQKLVANSQMQQRINMEKERLKQQQKEFAAKQDKAKDEDLSFEEKEKIKIALREDKDLRKENREVNRNLVAGEKKLKQALDNLETLKKDYKKFSKDALLTGPALGNLASLGEEESKMNARLKENALEEMGRMFEGMSKAVDSDAERRFFEQSQMSLTNRKEANAAIIDQRIEKTKKLLSDIQKARAHYKETGGLFEGDLNPRQQREQGYQEPSPKDDRVRMKIPDGRIKLIPRDQVEAAKKAGAEEL